MPDSRPTTVFNSVRTGRLKVIDAGLSARLIRASDVWKRLTGFEYVRNEPYVETGVEELVIPPEMDVEDVKLVSPEPGTLPDDLYLILTGRMRLLDTDKTRLTEPSRLPLTVHPRYFQFQPIYGIRPGERLDIKVSVRNPGIEAATMKRDLSRPDFFLQGQVLMGSYVPGPQQSQVDGFWSSFESIRNENFPAGSS